VDWGRVGRIIAAAQWRYLAAAGAITSFSYFLRSLRWRILLNTETWFSVGTVFWPTWPVISATTFLPARREN